MKTTKRSQLSLEPSRLKADVILKYSPDEARNLKSYGEFPESVKINETVTFGEEGYDDEIEFDEVSSDEEDENDPITNI